MHLAKEPGGEKGGDASVLPPSYNGKPTPPLPDLSAAFSNLNFEQTGVKPTADQCAAHLKLLEAFSQLREDVSTTDGLYGLSDSILPVVNDERQKTQVMAKIREKRWAVYVTIAVQRFTSWFGAIQPDAQMLRVDRMEAGWYAQIPNHSKPLQFTQDTLPPIGELSLPSHCPVPTDPVQMFCWSCTRSS